jgi:hypothetical protein
MTDHQGLPVNGYRAQPDEAVQAVNVLKLAEEQVLRLLDDLGEDDCLAVDRRWLAIGRTSIEQGFMAANRAIFKPSRIDIPEEDEPVVESGWVLERADSDPAAPLYYAPWTGGEQWSSNPAYALRLAREEDAARLAAAIGVRTRVCEHQWG